MLYSIFKNMQATLTETKKKSTITCPECEHQKTEEMAENSCQYFYECEDCGTLMRAKDGDCCVFCSYGSEPCPPIQNQLNTTNESSLSQDQTHKYIQRALILSLITIIYNLAEGTVSTILGAGDETLALFGFGVDSFVEVISGFGIAHMIWRMRKYPVAQRDQFETTALKITGSVFYLLTFGLVVGAIFSIVADVRPESTFVGIIIAGLSILTMYFLYKAKVKVGTKLNSDPIISDANCTKTCFYLSFILLASSLLYEWFGLPYVDALGSLGIAWYAFKEGKEAFQKAKNKSLSCTDCCH